REKRRQQRPAPALKLPVPLRRPLRRSSPPEGTHMPAFRPFVRVLPILLSTAFLAVLVRAAAPQPVHPPTPNKPAEEGDVEVKCIDSSVMRLKLLDDKL